MTRARIAAAAVAGTLVLLALAAAHRARDGETEPTTVRPAELATSTGPAVERDLGEFLHGVVTTHDGATYEGRLRWGGDQEAFWGDYFNGVKSRNPWTAHAQLERPAQERRPFRLFGVELGRRGHQTELDRPLMARFGDVARIEARDDEVRVTLKSGAAFDVDRLEANDFDDGVRVWDDARGVVDLGHRQVHSVELSPSSAVGAGPRRLHGTVRTPRGDFTGFLQWNRRDCVGTDELEGQTPHGAVRIPFDMLRSITRRSDDSSVAALLDGREIVLTGHREVAGGNRGVYVDDLRYGRVLVSWRAFERLDFSAGGSGPGYDDFPPGRPLTGSVTARDGRRLRGRLVYDLDESETTETLDAPSQGVHYTIPFGLIASIAPRHGAARDARGARVTLHDGEELQLERRGDLGDDHAGMLIFADAHEGAEYVPWSDVELVELERPPATYPPLGALAPEEATAPGG